MDKLSRAAEEARQDSNNRLDALTRSLDEFGRTVAENNSRALIDALKDVIHEFNEKISEQFGKNFRQLNHAVGQILVWQEQYRQQMSVMIEQQKVTGQNMATATERYQRLMERAEAFDAVANSMGRLIDGLDVQTKQLDLSLSSLAVLSIYQFSRHPQSFGSGRHSRRSFMARQMPRVNQQSLPRASVAG